MQGFAPALTTKNSAPYSILKPSKTLKYCTYLKCSQKCSQKVVIICCLNSRGKWVWAGGQSSLQSEFRTATWTASGQFWAVTQKNPMTTKTMCLLMPTDGLWLESPTMWLKHVCPHQKEAATADLHCRPWTPPQDCLRQSVLAPGSSQDRLTTT